jgi:hypothetical protein
MSAWPRAYVRSAGRGESGGGRHIAGPLRQDAVGIRNAPGLVRRIGA